MAARCWVCFGLCSTACCCLPFLFCQSDNLTLSRLNSNMSSKVARRTSSISPFEPSKKLQDPDGDSFAPASVLVSPALHSGVGRTVNSDSFLARLAASAPSLFAWTLVITKMPLAYLRGFQTWQSHSAGYPVLEYLYPAAPSMVVSQQHQPVCNFVSLL